MNKELQDHIWSILPKEFKEEVRTIYAATLRMVDRRDSAEQIYINKLSTLEGIFGFDNLTSDAEGEEMLMCVKHKVLGFYQEALELIDRGERNNYLNDKLVGIGQKNVLYALFGSKCLPDDKADEKVDEKNSPNADSSEQKPPEPKFKKGDIVRYVGDMQPTYRCKAFVMDGEVFFNDYYNQWQTTSIKPFAWDGLSVCNIPLTDLEPYIEPKEESRNLSQETANCDKQFDNILKDSLSKERRLNIAAMMAQGIMANSNPQMVEMNVERVVDLAILTADTLIAECEKGECK